MNRVVRAIEVMSGIAGHVAGWVVIGIMSLTMVEVITRYVLHHPLILSDEFGGYSLVFISFLGLAYCWISRGHIRITFLVERLPAKVSNWLRVVTIVIALVWVGLAAGASYGFIMSAFQRNMKSNSWLMTPLQWPAMAIPIGFLLFAFILLIDLIRTIVSIRGGANIESVYKKEAEEGSVL